MAKKEHYGTDILNSSFQFGNGYKAFASDFEERIIIKITAEVIISNLQNKNICCDQCNGEGYTHFIYQGEPDLDSLCFKCNSKGTI